jgi:site-specific DNA recombinase
MRVAIYARVSTDAQERDGTSLDSQIDACESFAAAAGWTVFYRIRDAASGFVLERPGLEQLRRLVREHQVDAVLSYAVDRLSRNQNHIGVLFDEVSSSGLRLEFATETFEDTAVGRFILAARAFVAEIEREKIRERTMRGKAERAKAGRMPQGTGKGIYGYTYDQVSGRRIAAEPQASVVRRIFDEFAHGASIVGIANKLNEDGITAFLGKKWHNATVFRLLKNDAYSGHTIYRRTRATSIRDPHHGRRRRHISVRDRDEWIEIPDATEPIVSEELFQCVQQRLQDPERLRMGRRTSAYALAGHIRCSACGASMVGQTLQQRYQYYRCRRAFAGPKYDRCSSRYVRAEAIEAAVKDAVANVLSHPELIVAELHHQESIASSNVDLDNAIAALDAEKKQVLRRYQAGGVDDEVFEQELMRLRKDRERVLTRRATASQKVTGSLEGLNLEAVCEGVREAAGDDMALVADALDLQVSASREHASLVGNLPVFTHHCTNIGMTTCT